MPAYLSLTGGAAFLVGQFRFFFGSELWEWSPEAAQIHGYPAAEMTSTS
jgi:hypothetical protein